MPFNLRKSINFGNGLRVNLSKSGIGFSVGTKGYRVSTGPRGTFINIGGGGIYYKQKVGGPYGKQSQSKNETFSLDQSHSEIPTADASSLIDISYSDFLKDLNEKIGQPKYAIIIAYLGVFFTLLSFTIHPIFALLMAIAFCIFFYMSNQFDNERTSYSLNYMLDTESQMKWDNINLSIHTLMKSKKIWRVVSFNNVIDPIHSIGATSLIAKKEILLARRKAPHINSNLSPFCLDIGSQSIFFLPDKLYFYQNGLYGAIEYDKLNLKSYSTSFIESDPLPSDASIIDYTWTYPKKDGGPDLRYANNQRIPIVKYGVLEWSSSHGMKIILYVSSNSISYEFCNAFTKALQTYHNPSDGTGKDTPQYGRKINKDYNYTFKPDNEAKNRWINLQSSLSVLSKNNKIWIIDSFNENCDYNSLRTFGATELVKRREIKVCQECPSHIKSNIIPFCLKTDTLILYFFPHILYILSNGHYQSIEYNRLNIKHGTTNFLESEPIPSDTAIVDYMWTYSIKDGSPDLRYSNNPKIPIVKYGTIEINLNNTQILIYTSSFDLSNEFYVIFMKFISSLTNDNGYTNHKSKNNYSSKDNEYSDFSNNTNETIHSDKDIPNCYTVLGLKPNCSKEEAQSRYKELVTAYHPDKVNHLAAEFKELAHKRLVSFNQAYSELKRLKGW